MSGAGSLHILTLILCFVQAGAFTRFIIPSYTTDDWHRVNSDLKDLITPLHHDLCQRDITTTEAADRLILSCSITTLLSLISSATETRNPTSRMNRRPFSDARKKKNALRRKAYGKNANEEDRRNFRDAVKAVSFLKKKM